MKKYIVKRILALAASGLFILNSAVIAVSPDEYFTRTHIAHENTYQISDGATYTQNVIYDDKLGFQNMYKFEFEDTEFSELVFSGGDSIYSRSSMDSLAQNIDESHGNVVGAVNADFFNMATGVPESAFIKDGVVYTSDRSSYCFAKKSDGSYFFGIPDIHISMLRGDTEYNIVFLNKELANNGIYIYTDKFSVETKIKVPTTEIVLYPYSEMYTPREIAEMYFGSDEIPEDLYEKVETVIQVTETIEEVVVSEESDNDICEVDTECATEYESDADNDDAAESEINSDIISDEHAENENIPTADSTTIDNSAEQETEYKFVYTDVFNENYRPIIDIFAFDRGYKNIEGNYFKITDAQPQIGKEQNAVVVETRFNKEAKSLPIPEGAYVLSSDNAGYGYTLNNFKNGETVVIKVTANEQFADVTDAIGCGCMIVKNGEIVEDNSQSHYASQQPRTAIGLKEDGSVVLFAVDGRKPGISSGLRLSDLSAEMIRAGCVEAANFDGGGSTTVKVVNFEDNKLVTGNKPSDTSERKVSNAVVITNKAEKEGNAVYSYVETEKAFVMPNSVIPVSGKITYSDKNHIAAVAPDTDSNVFKYTAENGIITEEGYTPAGFVGADSIISSYGEDYSNIAGKIISVDTVDEIILTADKSSIYPHESIQLSVDSTLYGWKVYDSLSEYSFVVSADNGYVDENAVYYPAFASENTELFAYFGETSGKISVNVLPYPFKDIVNHWSVGYCCTLFDKGVTIGEITPDGRMYFPERTYTRNEFCVMLSRILGLTVAEDTVETVSENDGAPDILQNGTDGSDITLEFSEQSNNVSDVEKTVIDEYAVPTESTEIDEELVEEQSENIYGKTMFADDTLIPEWAYNSVCALYELGLLSDFAHNNVTDMLFDGSNPVTRREVMSVIGRLFENAPDDYELDFADYDNNSSDSQYVKNSAYAGIIEGYEDGSLRPDGYLTRAEGAAVFTRILEFDLKLN